MEKNSYIECAEVAFSDLKIVATQEQIELVAEYFEQHVENSFDSRGDLTNYGTPDCQNCKKLEEEIERLKRVIEVHENSVKNRRNCDKVWANVEQNVVQYE